MPSLEERVALLEGRVQEQGAFMTELRSAGAELGRAMGELRAEMGRRFDAVDRRFEAVDRRLEGIDQRFDGMERRFAWLVGIVVTGFVTMIGTVAGAFWGVLQVVR